MARGVGYHEREPGLLGDNAGCDAASPIQAVRSFGYFKRVTVHVDVQFFDAEFIRIVSSDWGAVTPGKVAGEFPYIIDHSRIE